MPILFFSEQIFHFFIDPDPSITSLLYRRASLADSPYCFRNRCRIIQIKVGEVLLDCIRGRLGLVVWNRRIKVVSHVRRSNFMVQKVNNPPRVQFIVGAIDCMQGALDEVVVVL